MDERYEREYSKEQVANMLMATMDGYDRGYDTGRARGKVDGLITSLMGGLLCYIVARSYQKYIEKLKAAKEETEAEPEKEEFETSYTEV